MRYINLLTYLLTYLLTEARAVEEIRCMVQMDMGMGFPMGMGIPWE